MIEGDKTREPPWPVAGIYTLYIPSLVYNNIFHLTKNSHLFVIDPARVLHLYPAWCHFIFIYLPIKSDLITRQRFDAAAAPVCCVNVMCNLPVTPTSTHTHMPGPITLPTDTHWLQQPNQDIPTRFTSQRNGCSYCGGKANIWIVMEMVLILIYHVDAKLLQ